MDALSFVFLTISKKKVIEKRPPFRAKADPISPPRANRYCQIGRGIRLALKPGVVCMV
jgi:hypothetical protein